MKRNLILCLMVGVVFVSANIIGPFVPEAPASFFGTEKKIAQNWEGVKSVKFTLLGGLSMPESESKDLAESPQFSLEASLGGIMTDKMQSDLTFHYLDIAGVHPVYVGALKEKFYFRDLYQSAKMYPYTFAIVGVAFMKETTRSELQDLPVAEDMSEGMFDSHTSWAGGLGMEWLVTPNVWIVVEGGYYDFGEDMKYVMLKAGASVGMGW